MKRILILLLYLPMLAWGQPLETIGLRHRMADQLLPALQPFVEPGGVLTGMNDKLFLRASARNQAEIRRLVAELDVPVRRLLISVRQEGDDVETARGGRVEGAVSIRDGKVGAGGTAQMYSSSRAGDDRVSQQVQTIDGGRASIVVGQSLWLPLRQVVLGPGGAIVSETVVQRDLGTGFVAVPRLSGNRVAIEISPWRDVADGSPLDTRSERLSTTVSGPLGEWIVLGGQRRDETGAGSGASWSSRSASRQRRLLLKVDELP